MIPVKAFREAKVRLAPAMSAPERAALAQRMATQVVASAAGLPVAVVCDDPEVAAWARRTRRPGDLGTGAGLNGAVQEGVAPPGVPPGPDWSWWPPGTFPLATDLRWVARFPGVTIVPDRRRDGTNVISVPTASGFRSPTGRARSRVISTRPGTWAFRSAWCIPLPWPGMWTCRTIWPPSPDERPDGPRLACERADGRSTGTLLWLWPSEPILTTSSSGAAARWRNGRLAAVTSTISSAPMARRVHGTPTRIGPRSVAARHEEQREASRRLGGARRGHVSRLAGR